MAFQILTHQSLQTAVNAAAERTAALVQAKIIKTEEDEDRFFSETVDKVFDRLSKEAEKNNETLREEEKSSGGARKGGSRPTKGGSKARRGGSGGGKGKKTFTFDEAGEVVVNFGKFEGASIAEIHDMDESDAAEYDYDKAGAEWLTWAEENAKSGYLRDAITAYLEGVN